MSRRYFENLLGGAFKVVPASEIKVLAAERQRMRNAVGKENETRGYPGHTLGFFENHMDL